MTLSEVMDRTGAGGQSGARSIGWLLFFTAGAIMPLAIVELPPLNDYVNHLVRLRMIAQWGSDPHLLKFYNIEWAIVPNLAIDLTVPGLVHLIGEFAAGKVFIIVLFTLQMTGIAAIQHAAYGRVTYTPLLGTLFLYNLCLLYGLLNYTPFT
jgi:hypothetical protein